MSFKVKILPAFLCIVLFLFGCQKKQEAYDERIFYRHFKDTL